MAGGAIAGGALGAAAATEKARAEANAAELNAEIASRNSEIAFRQGLFEEERLRERLRRVIGAQRAAAGAAGIAVGEGAPFEVLLDTVAEGELEALAIRFRRDINTQAFDIERKAQKLAARDIRRAGFLAAGAAFFGNAGPALGNTRTTQPTTSDSSISGSSGFAGSQGSPRAAGAI